MRPRGSLLWFAAPLLMVNSSLCERSDVTFSKSAAAAHTQQSKIGRTPATLAEAPAAEEDEEDEELDEPADDEGSAEDAIDHIEDAKHRAALAAEDDTRHMLEIEREKGLVGYQVLEHKKRIADKAVQRQFKIDEEQEEQQIHDDAAREAKLIEKDAEGESKLQDRIDKRDVNAEIEKLDEEDTKAREAIQESKAVRAEALSEQGAEGALAGDAEQNEKTPPLSTDLRGFGGCASGLPDSSSELDTVCGGAPNKKAPQAGAEEQEENVKEEEGAAEEQEAELGVTAKEEKNAGGKHGKEEEEAEEKEENHEYENSEAGEEGEDYENEEAESFLEKLIRNAIQRKEHTKEEYKRLSFRHAQPQQKRVYLLSFIA